MFIDLVGPLTATSAGGCFLGALLAWRRQRPAAALAWIVAGGALLRVYLGTDLFLHPWDERYHALVARHLIEHPLEPQLYRAPVFPYDPHDWMANHVWLHKPPLALWLGAGSMALFGVQEVAFRLPSLIGSGLAILVTYRIAVLVFDQRTGLIAAFLHAGSGLIILLAAGVMTSDAVDSLFVVLVELAALLAFLWARKPSRWRAVAAGSIVGLALLTKSWPALLVVPLQAWLGWRRHTPRVLATDLALTAAAAALVSGPWFIYVHWAFPNEAAAEQLSVIRHFTESIEGQPTALSYYLLRVPRAFGELVYVPVLWFVVRACRGRLSPEAFAILLWIALPFCVFGAAASKSISYLAVAAPALFIVQASFVVALSDAKPEAAWTALARRVALVLFLVLPLRFAVERLNPLHGRDRRAPWAEGLRALRPVLSSSVVLFGTDHPIEAMFITDATAYGFLPTPDQVMSVKQQGRTAVVCADTLLPITLASDTSVLKVRCRQ
jgi:4-amino-4-deoxy-L-arabinose transferase-like glycosyltransferase